MFTPAEKHPRSYTVWLSVYEKLVQVQSFLSKNQEEISAGIEAIVAGLHDANPDAKQKPFQALTLPDALVTRLRQLQTKLVQDGLIKEELPLFNRFLAVIPSWSGINLDSKLHLFNCIDQQKTKEDLLILSQTDFKLFKTPVHLSRLLLAVVHGDQPEAERILKKYPHLLLERGNVTDYSGRTFLNITPFEYALWALDVKYMCPMMINCLPKDENGEKIRESLLKQSDNLEKEGIDYILDEEKHRERHYNFKSLTGNLQIYIDNFYIWTDTERENHWCKEVGKAQTFVPAHVAQHYCDPEEPFDPLPAFKKKKRPQSMEFCNYLTDKTELWFSAAAGGLGVNFGILRAGGSAWCGIGRWSGSGVAGVGADLAALSVLCEVRTSHDLVVLREQLETPLQKPEQSAADHLCQAK